MTKVHSTPFTVSRLYWKLTSKSHRFTQDKKHDDNQNTQSGAFQLSASILIVMIKAHIFSFLHLVLQSIM